MPKTLYFYPAVMAGLLLGSASAWGQAVSASPLNDTGLTWSSTGTTGNSTTCNAADPAGQDCQSGRDAAALLGTLTKTGASTLNNGQANGFDFTKISNKGTELAATATLGSEDDDWACTRDNVTGLIWEVKVDNSNHLRHQGHSYTWYNTDPATNGGYAGVEGEFFDNSVHEMKPNAVLCSGSGMPQCNTQAYIAAVNAQRLCGYNDWRMPTQEELVSLLDYGRTDVTQPMIDPDYFPHTSSNSVVVDWAGLSSATVGAHPTSVDFLTGVIGQGYAMYPGRVRAVRSAP